MSKINVSFDGVSAGFVGTGTHVAKITACDPDEGKNGPYLRWTLEVISGNDKDKTIKTITSLSQKALFKLKELFDACGVKTPKGNFSFDTKQFIGKTLCIDVADGEPTAEGKVYSEVKRFKPVATAVEQSSGAVQGTDSDDEIIMEDEDEINF